ncbi:MAG: hypothetical protein CMJ59_00995 [Planctomycetaceae bacterium]|nr:hypothetical protein [Planctomycetaceae bacterium]
MSPFTLDLDACRARQRRLLEWMQETQLDLIVVTQKENIQWLSGQWFNWYFQPTVALRADGHFILVAPSQPPVVAAADEVLHYEAQWHSTLRNDQRAASAATLWSHLEGTPTAHRIGVEFSTFGPHLATQTDAELIDIEPQLYSLRRRKDTDELEMIRQAIAGTQAMYERAREIIEPGISELEVFNQLQAAAVDRFGEMLTGTGNDYQCRSPGGAPRAGQRAADGDLYILDLGPAFRGYFADNCRTIAVSKPTEEQLLAWNHVTAVFEHVEQSVKPGKNARELFDEAQAMLDAAPLGTFNHHLGHGFGLFPHEAPHLNPHWDDVFECGDTFTVEPGLYAPELQAGMRLEQNYVVLNDGVELLTTFPLEL